MNDIALYSSGEGALGATQYHCHCPTIIIVHITATEAIHKHKRTKLGDKNEYQGRRWHLLKANTEPGPTELRVILHWLFDSATFWHISKTTSLRLGEHNNLGYLFHKQGSVKAKETKTNVDCLVHLDPSFLPCTSTSSAIFPTTRTEPRTIAPSRLPKTAPMTLISCSNSFM